MNLYLFTGTPVKKLKPTSAQELSFGDRLRENVRAVQMHIRKNVPSDGNCFFHCVSDQLDRLGLPSRSHKEIRSDLVSSLHILVIIVRYAVSSLLKLLV